MNIDDLLEGGYAKKPYLPIGKQFVCGKERVIYKKNVNNDSSKVYMRHNAKYIQVVNFEKEMIAKGKWKLPTPVKTPVKQSKNKPNVKPCKEDQYRNPATGRCVKIKPDKDPAKPVKPAKPAKPVKPAKTIKSPISLIGKYVVLADDITGSKYFYLKDLIHAKGGEAHTLNYVNDNVWEKMNIFIAKDIKANTEKLKKAKQFNLTIIKYDTFMKLYATPVKPAKTDVKPQNNTISMVVIGMLMNKNVTFTGIRDKNLEAVIEANGGKVFSTVSKKVDLLIAKDKNANSASIIKAKQLNIDIIQYDILMQY
jgi:NAD-dependent DNA ligase